MSSIKDKLTFSKKKRRKEQYKYSYKSHRKRS